MKTIAAGLTLILASCSAVAPAEQAGTSARDNRISIYLGQRSLDKDDYSPVEDQPTFGIEFARESAGSPVGFEVGIMGSKDDGSDSGFDLKASTREIYAGVKKTFGSDVVRPYIGGGLSYINAKVEVSGFGDEDDSSIAGYLHGGVGFQVSDAINLGLDLRYLFGSDISFAGFDTDADYVQFALTAGFGF